MSKTTKWLLTLVLIFLVENIYAQRTNFIATDSTLNSGVKLIKGTPAENAQFILSKEDFEIIKYGPEDIKSYGFKNGRIFDSFKAKIDGVEGSWFFRRVFKGKHSIYFLHVNGEEKYFIMPNDSLPLKEIPSEGMEDFLKSYVSDCERAQINLKHVKMNENSIGRFFTDYQNCSDSYLPRLRYSVLAGVSLTGLSSSSAQGLISIPDYDQMIGLHVGFRVIKPLAQSNFALVTGPTFQNYKSSNKFTNNNLAYDLVVNQFRVNLPLLVRYTFYNKKSSPFLEIGPAYSRFLRGQNTMYSYETVGTSIFIENLESTAIAEDQVGLSVNGGFIIDYDSNLSFSCQVGFEKWYSTNVSDESLSINQFVITLGLLF